jgi:hypothetical protein
VSSKRPRTSAPKPPPYPVGARLHYLGKRHVRVGSNGGGFVDIIAPAMTVTIEEVKIGTRGTGVQLRDADGPMFYEDDGEPILDETRDGYSIYYVIDERGKRHGRCILRDTAKEWERVKP